MFVNSGAEAVENAIKIAKKFTKKEVSLLLLLVHFMVVLL